MQATLSHYRILEQIGAGGMGVVFRAHDERLDRDVALKLLSAARDVDPAAHKRFHREALTLSRLNHPNIATVHDFGTEDGSDYLVEEYIEGCSLDMVLAHGPLAPLRILDFGLQLAEGLAAAHERGVIHCDLKPSNVRITPDGRAKILDFGLARMMRRESHPNAETETLTETGCFAGTLPYMAPEHLLGRKVDQRTDIWALGCVLYEMAAGKRAFFSVGPALTEAILHQQPVRLSTLNPAIGSVLEEIVNKCLDKDPNRRYQSAKEIAVDFRRAASPELDVAAQPHARWKGRAIALAFITIAVAILGIRMWPFLQLSWSEWRAQVPVAATHVAPHELYLAGLGQMERWDKAANLESAIHSFNQAVLADPGFALAFSALGEAYWAKYRLDRDTRWIGEAEKNCRRAAELSNKIPAVYVTLARVHNGRGHYNLALEEIQQALKLEPNGADALLTEAEIYTSMGRHDEAESIYRRATTLRPEYWGGYYEMGAFYFRMQRFQDASAQLEHVLELTPDNAVAHFALGGVLQMLSRFQEAESHLKKSIELQPTYAAYNNLGVLYYNQRRWTDAISATRKALDVNANDWRTWSNLGLAYEWLGRKSEADEAFRNEQVRLEEAETLNPGSADVEVTLGALYARQKLRKKALAQVESALARAGDDPEILISAAEAYDRLGDRERALKLVARGLENGWTLAQLQNDPGQQAILHDPRFTDRARRNSNDRGPAQ